jgi:hypothetical protein
MHRAAREASTRRQINGLARLGRAIGGQTLDFGEYVIE